MAYSRLQEWIIRLFRARQEDVVDRTRSEMRQAWPILQFNDIDGSQVPWAAAATGVIARNRTDSVLAAQEMVTTLRWADDPFMPPIEWEDPVVPESEVYVDGETFDVPDVIVDGPDFDDVPDVLVEGPEFEAPPDTLVSGPPLRIDAPKFEPKRAAVSMLATGPGKIMHDMPAPEAELSETAENTSENAAVKRVADGGREQVKTAVEADPDAKGFSRATDGSPCAFCAMLASRGPVYTSADVFDESNVKYTGEGTAKVHDGCGCTLVPFYSGEPWVEGSYEILQMYEDVTGNFFNADKRRAFRRAWEAQKRGTAERGPRKYEPPPPGWQPGPRRSAKPSGERRDTRTQELWTSNDFRSMREDALAEWRDKLDSVLDRGFGEDSPQVRKFRQEIARLEQSLT